MIRQRADGSVWQKPATENEDWKQLQDGNGPGPGPAAAGADEPIPLDGEPATDQWAGVAKQHNLDGHVPEATIHPSWVATDLAGDTDAKAVLSWQDSAGQDRRSYTTTFHYRRAALEQPMVAASHATILAAHEALGAELKGPRAPAAALAIAHLQTGHDLADLAASDVYHNRGQDGLDVAQSKGVKITQSHTADASHPDKVHLAVRHKRGHVVLAPIHHTDLAEHHAQGMGHSTPEEAQDLLAEHGVLAEHAPAVRSHAIHHLAADQLSKLPPADMASNFREGVDQVLGNVRAVSDYIADVYGHPPSPPGMSYVPPMLVASYMEEAGAAKHWPKAFAALHTDAPEPSGVVPVAESKRKRKTYDNEAAARKAAKVRAADEATWASVVADCTMDGSTDWTTVVRVHNSMKYGRAKEAPCNSTNEATSSSTEPSATASSPLPSPSSSTPTTSEPKLETASPSPLPSATPPAREAPRVGRVRPREGAPWVEVQPEDLKDLGLQLFVAASSRGAEWRVKDRTIEVARADGDRAVLASGKAVRWTKLYRAVMQSHAASPVPGGTNIDKFMHKGAQPDLKAEAVKNKARQLFIKCMDFARKGKIKQSDMIPVMDCIVEGKFADAIFAMRAIPRVQVAQSEGPPGAPSSDTSGSSTGKASAGKRRKYSVGEVSTWADGTRHVKTKEGEWRDEPGSGKKSAGGKKKDKGDSVTLKGARARLKKLREMRRRTSSKESKLLIDKQIAQVKKRIEQLSPRSAGASGPDRGSATQNAGSRTGVKHSLYRELNALAARAQDATTPLSETFQQLDRLVVRVAQSATETLDAYCATRPGYVNGVAFLASDACPAKLRAAASSFIKTNGVAALAVILGGG